MWGLVLVKGVFREVTGNGSVSAAGDVTGTITVVAASVDTKNKKRDEHLRSADFFDVSNHPAIIVVVDNMIASDEGVTVTGTLTVRGHSRPLSFDTKVASADGEALLDGEIRVDRADFGLTWNRMGKVSMHNTITVHLAFTRS